MRFIHKLIVLSVTGVLILLTIATLSGQTYVRPDNRHPLPYIPPQPPAPDIGVIVSIRGVPYLADIDGDKRVDMVLYQDTGRWVIRLSREWWKKIYVIYWGTAERGDVPVAPRDWDGDGMDDLAVFRSVSGCVLVRSTRTGQLVYAEAMDELIPKEGCF